MSSAKSERLARREARNAARQQQLQQRADRNAAAATTTTRSSSNIIRPSSIRQQQQSQQSDGQRRANPHAATAIQSSSSSSHRQPANAAPSDPNAAGHYATPGEKSMLTTLRDSYKKAALNHKMNGDQGEAIRMIRIAKQLDILITAIDEGKPVDLRGIPMPAPVVRRRGQVVQQMQQIQQQRKPQSQPQVPLVQVNGQQEKFETTTDAAPTRKKRINPESYTDNVSDHEVNSVISELLTASKGRDSPTPSVSSAVSGVSGISGMSTAISSTDVARLFNAPESANTVLEALNQRIDKYKSTMDAAKNEGNAAKARRLGRIVKQYENAITAYTSKKDFDYDSLPVPPGFPPIPFDLPAEPVRRTGSGRRRTAPDPPPPSPATSTMTASAHAAGTNTTSYRPKTEVNEKIDQMMLLQSTLKAAAIDHKKSGDVQEALQLMRLAKGFDPVIEAVKCGLPVDEDSIPQIPDEIMLRLKSLSLTEGMDKQ
jgi:hypothetical protein